MLIGMMVFTVFSTVRFLKVGHCIVCRSKASVGLRYIERFYIYIPRHLYLYLYLYLQRYRCGNG